MSADYGVVDPRAGRQRRLVFFLQIALGAVAILAALSLVARGELGLRFAQVMVGVLVAVPIVRIGWLITRWYHRPDRRFALVGLGLLVIVAAAMVLGRR